MTIQTAISVVVSLSLGMHVTACASDDAPAPAGEATDGGGTGADGTYTFESKLETGVSSVSYSGQIARHLLIADLTTFIKGMTEQIDSGTWTPTAAGDVVSELDYFLRFDSDADGGSAHKLSTTPAAKQVNYEDVSTGKDLISKLAGRDTATDHKNLSEEFAGWSDTAITTNGGALTSPEGLLLAFFSSLEARAIARSNGDISMHDQVELPVYVTPAGQDLAQLTQKFLLVAITYHQATDDYLDSDVADKGLQRSNVTPEEGKPYTQLEHAWDEAFGYFGAARDYAAYTDDEVAAAGGRDDWQGYHDTDGDGAIDLGSEYCFGAAGNASKRDRGSNPDAATDFSGDIISGFVAGRLLIARAVGELNADELAMLESHRDQIVRGWEMAYGATVVHYINDTLQDLGTLGTDEFSFADLAKHWSELKGFALGFQFNPRSALTSAQFAQLHTLIGDAPVFAGDVDGYKADLIAARGLLQGAFGFADSNMGDAEGNGGW
ncbi:MAG: hypothetical protein ACI9WU_000619 [Myxococcota bacterium]|jgi:hypothetical protein